MNLEAALAGGRVGQGGVGVGVGEGECRCGVSAGQDSALLTEEQGRCVVGGDDG